MKIYWIVITYIMSVLITQPIYGETKMTQENHKIQINAHDFSFNDIDGNPLGLNKFKNKILLVINVASKCGFTPQYQMLQKLYDTYHDKGFEIIAVPCNDFGSQEPDICPIIKDFATEKYSITFTMTDKYHVIGKNAHPFYLWANDKAGLLGSPKWNFHKYLIGKNGEFIDWFSSITSPDDKKIIRKIEEIL